jgi:hypothetical protein
VNEHREFEDLLFGKFERIGREMANPHRLELSDLLAQGERSVDDLARQTPRSTRRFISNSRRGVGGR